MPKRVLIKVMTPFLEASLVKQILIGLVMGVGLAMMAPATATSMGLLGSVFVSALKAVAPILVFVLVMSAIANQDLEAKAHIKPILVLYLIGTFCAAALAVLVSYVFPTQIHLVATDATANAPGGVGEVLKNVLFNIVDNPIRALSNGNYIGILVEFMSYRRRCF